MLPDSVEGPFWGCMSSLLLPSAGRCCPELLMTLLLQGCDIWNAPHSSQNPSICPRPSPCSILGSSKSFNRDFLSKCHVFPRMCGACHSPSPLRCPQFEGSF